VYLNGQAKPDIDGNSVADPLAMRDEWFFGGQSDNSNNFEGKMSDIAIFARALSSEEVARHYAAADVPRGEP
jgi:hypothetical protein